MTPQEAIEALKLRQIEIQGNAIRVADFFMGLAIAVSALEMQVPKKPINMALRHDGYYGRCPHCNEIVNDCYDYKICTRCGQVLDWGDTE